MSTATIDLPAAPGAQAAGVSPKRVFWATWAGWMLDAFDSTAYGLLLVSVWRDLLPRGGVEASSANIAVYGGIGFSVFMLGWAFSMFWGWLADRVGRVRTMICTILVYSLFTALCGLAVGPIGFIVLRFLVGFGVGGEWAAGTALLHESLPEQSRVRYAGWLHTATPIGIILASSISLLIVPVFGWRGMFLLGVAPALLTIYLRRNIPEPVRKSHAMAPRPTTALFTGAQARATWSAALMVSCGLFGIWSSSFWIPTVITTRLVEEGRSLEAAQQFASLANLAGNLGGLFGCLIMPWLAEKIPSRKAIALGFFAASLIANIFAYDVVISRLNNITLFLVLVPLLAFCTGTPFALFTIWLPELFPGHARGSGLGFTFSLGRILSAIGPLLVGILAAATGGYPIAISLISLIYIPAMIFTAFCRETAGKGLPA
jgi:MFS family permease